MVFCVSACGANTTANYYGPMTITVVTTDQFGNPVDGKIVYNGNMIGLGETKLSYNPANAGTLTFDANLPDYTPPAPLDLSVAKFADGEHYYAAYTREGSVANVCPRAISAEGVLVDAELDVNGLQVDYMAGFCQSVDILADTLIQSGGVQGLYASTLFIPAGQLEEGMSYFYDLFFALGDKVIFVATTPVSGEIFIDGRSVGWVKDDFVSILLTPSGSSNLSFGEVAGHQTPEAFSVVNEDVTETDNHYWALYDRSVNALVCFMGMAGEGYMQAGRVLVNDSETLDTGYNYPACIGLDASQVHTAEFLERDSYQSTDVLTISTAQHVGCEGDFVPGERLDCVGEYYWVQPVQDRTEFYIQVEFIGSYQGDAQYPIAGRYELDGIQHEQWAYGQTLKLAETLTLQFLPVGILQPSLSTITVDSSTLSEDDEAYDPPSNQWIYTVAYVPPEGATEACVTSFNQNGVNISTEVNMQFDGTEGLNSWEEDEDCNWLSAAGNHVIVPGWLSGYYPAVSQIHVPDGMIQGQNQFEMVYVPQPTAHQLCIKDVTAEAGLTVNAHFLGWTYFGTVCVYLDKGQPNTLTIAGVGSRSYVADDPALAGTYSEIQFADF